MSDYSVHTARGIASALYEGRVDKHDPGTSPVCVAAKSGFVSRNKALHWARGEVFRRQEAECRQASGKPS